MNTPQESVGSAATPTVVLLFIVNAIFCCKLCRTSFFVIG